MTPAEELDEYEQLARVRLEEFLCRQLRRIRPAGPSERHDFEAVLGHGRVAAVEVTSRLDDRRRKQLSAIRDRLASFPLPGSANVWAVQLSPRAQVSKINKGAVRRLLLDLEAAGLRRAHSMGNDLGPFTKRLRDLRIASAYAMSSGRSGRVVIGPDGYARRGWYGSVTDSWLAGFLASEQGRSKLEKLSRVTNAAEWHLVVVLDPSSPEGLSIPLGLTDRDEPGVTDQVMPSLTPPEPLTHLWLLPTVETWEGLRWDRSASWAILPAWHPLP